MTGTNLSETSHGREFGTAPVCEPTESQRVPAWSMPWPAAAIRRFRKCPWPDLADRRRQRMVFRCPRTRCGPPRQAERLDPLIGRCAASWSPVLNEFW